MIIKCVEIMNFRSIKDAILEFDNLTAIIGRNGAGKSSFLSAIDIFYNISSYVTEEDFHKRNLETPIEIRITFIELKDEEKQEFKPYIRDEKLIVTKKIFIENGKIEQRYYGAAMQIKKFAEIREIDGKKDRLSTWKNLVESGELPALEMGGARSADDVERLMTEYESLHPELLSPIEKEGQFFGAKSFGGGKLDKFTKFVLIPAVREASDEVSGKKGAIYQILDMIVLRKINSRKDVQEFKTEFGVKAKQLFSSENLTELSDLGQSISETLEKFAPGSKLNLKWDEIEAIDPPIPEAKATLIEDNFEGEITRKGHGLQRALIVTLLQHLAMIAPEINEGEEPLKPQEEDHFVGPNLILAIEEPELYLHPARCRYLSDLLLKLSEKKETGLGLQNQIIYTSHSPYFVDLNRFDNIRLVRKNFEIKTAPCSIISYFSLDKGSKELAKVSCTDPGRFNRDSFRIRAMSVMTTIVNEGFFADKVVVVEGTTDVSTLWKLQEILGKNWSKKGIVVVPAGGKNNIDRPVVIFKGLNIPTYFIFDADSHVTGAKYREEAKKRNHIYLRLAGAEIEDFPQTQINNNWAVFNKNLEETMKEILGVDIFQNIRQTVASELGYEECEKACKSIEGASRFIELVYEKKLNIPVLESIIEKISTF